MIKVTFKDERVKLSIEEDVINTHFEETPISSSLENGMIDTIYSRTDVDKKLMEYARKDEILEIVDCVTPIHIGEEPPENTNKIWFDTDLTDDDPIETQFFRPLQIPNYQKESELPTLSKVDYNLPNLKTSNQLQINSLPTILSNVDYNLPSTKNNDGKSLPKTLGSVDYNLPKL